MSQRIAAIFQQGVFRPETPVSLHDGERVMLSVESQRGGNDDLSDVRDLIDHEFMESCSQRGERAPELAQVQAVLSVFKGSLADRISEERGVN
jgi:predicted DNA-binding antitoxin AbrB/MazE fold protein